MSRRVCHKIHHRRPRLGPGKICFKRANALYVRRWCSQDAEWSPCSYNGRERPAEAAGVRSPDDCEFVRRLGCPPEYVSQERQRAAEVWITTDRARRIEPVSLSISPRAYKSSLRSSLGMKNAGTTEMEGKGGNFHDRSIQPLLSSWKFRRRSEGQHLHRRIVGVRRQWSHGFSARRVGANDSILVVLCEICVQKTAELSKLWHASALSKLQPHLTLYPQANANERRTNSLETAAAFERRINSLVERAAVVALFPSISNGPPSHTHRIAWHLTKHPAPLDCTHTRTSWICSRWLPWRHTPWGKTLLLEIVKK